MKKISKGKILILIIALIIIIPNINYATSIWAQGKDFITTGTANAGGTISSSELKSGVNSILKTIFPIGVVITILVGAVLGIQIMISPIDGKAEAKKALIPFVISCAVIYGSIGIWKAAVSIMAWLQ